VTRVSADAERGVPAGLGKEEDAASWDARVAANPLGSYLQTSAWAEAKAANGWSPVRVLASGEIGAQVLVRRPRPFPWTYAYAPRGPVAAAWDAGSIAAFTEALREILPQGGRRPSHVRIDPPVEANGSDDRDGATSAALRRLGWRPVPAVLPPSTHVVDLAGSEDDLWSGLRKKWRQYVNRGRHAGLEVVAGGRDELAEFHAIYADTAKRTGFAIRPMSEYTRVWDAFSRTASCELLFARLPDGEAVSTLFLIRCGDRVVEPWGGMTGAGADTRASYLLKWEAMRRSRAAGATLYDMWGGLLMSGIAHFKRGFGGRDVEYVGTWDLVLDPLAWLVYSPVRRTIVRTQRAVRRLRRSSQGGSGPERWGDGADD
jgi:lipid II:glycine glycyltransferase (peptidoglycan interpeptide bridge formation enzyme)